ncbi:MAG: glycoside hydrolase family 28 protein, partial [Candidatus Hydrogenedentes bacterium]|nr:glycoside hydrolase family 28 protein [Candidatus Hydrogenedentota bacterium]
MFGDLPAYGFYFRHVKGLRLNDLDLTYEKPDARPALFAEDVFKMRVAMLSAQSEKGAAAQVVLKDVRNALITGCVATGAETFLRQEGACEDIRLMQNDLIRR